MFFLCKFSHKIKYSLNWANLSTVVHCNILITILMLIPSFLSWKFTFKIWFSPNRRKFSAMVHYNILIAILTFIFSVFFPCKLFGKIIPSVSWYIKILIFFFSNSKCYRNWGVCSWKIELIDVYLTLLTW